VARSKAQGKGKTESINEWRNARDRLKQGVLVFPITPVQEVKASVSGPAESGGVSAQKCMSPVEDVGNALLASEAVTEAFKEDKAVAESEGAKDLTADNKADPVDGQLDKAKAEYENEKPAYVHVQ